MRSVRASAAAALAAAVLAGCSGSTAPDTLPLGDSTAQVPPGLEVGCPPDDTALRLPISDLPPGAAGVRLCPGAPVVGRDGTRHGPFVQPVSDELTTGVESLVDLVNGLPEHEPGACQLDGGPLLVYWFRYPDGDARAVAYGERGCHTLTAGEGLVREDGEKLAHAFADALRSQRAASAPPVMTQERRKTPKCGLPNTETPVSMLPQLPPTMTDATWCQGVAPYRMRTASVPASLVRRLNEGLVGEPVEGRDPCKPVTYGESIEGVNEWGDRVSYWVVSDCRIHARVGYGRDTATATFAAAPELVRALRALPPTAVLRWKRE
ncbi:hypothetical protein [Nocardioides renjunii]|uniref:hypothetical protein n=1 Tax=Nocardioides renjunii TaxID=3095075 RepID=UPI002AFFE733|nr:hypothetical protein [Nocardioides sp. S-34]WQQ20708.1 hypothetical protein SHK17_12425 [Nocardioides sp. S-34]